MMEQELISQDDMKLAQLVRETLHAATQPQPEQLARLMPPIPRRKTAQLTWQRQWAALAACAILLLSGMGVFFTRQQGWVMPISPTTLSVTATTTQTQTPVATLAETMNTSPDRVLPQQTVAALTAVQSAAVATPSPNPTPEQFAINK
ncbi:MAG: hypothetical protein H6662_10725 [Ardenticatenaceae bacterium]|nr:hypothetical protein [Anaerolineales bacterium]MCA9956862.1 hypothetical protein [Anaerolineales bacterium]MCB8922049.1 hypothetical protein [Ardenticatenaceae bacterium]MCB9003166.1 hypothetical protein [Ardenticatenaceae bacterium]